MTSQGNARSKRWGAWYASARDMLLRARTIPDGMDELKNSLSATGEAATNLLAHASGLAREAIVLAEEGLTATESERRGPVTQKRQRRRRSAPVARPDIPTNDVDRARARSKLVRSGAFMESK